MEIKYAKQIADLLNERNKLVVRYDTNRVIKLSANFEYLLDKTDNVIGAIEIKKVQWYQWELCHLTVDIRFEGKGYGGKLIKKAEAKAKKEGALIIQCTIREDNERSKNLFSKNGYKHKSTFYYPMSGHNVTVWQKVISQG